MLNKNIMKKKGTKKQTYLNLLLFLLLCSVIMLRQLIVSGYFSVIKSDVYTYTNWAWQFNEALKEGVFYPRWLPLYFHGYGSPIFVLYPPLAFYLSAFFNFFTNSIITAMNVTKFVALFLSTVGMFFLVKEFCSEKIAFYSALFFMTFPYTIFQFYYIGQYASVISFIWFAPIVLFTYRYLKKNEFKDLFYASLSFAGLIVTHVINAYMFTFIIFIFIVYFAISQKKVICLTAIPGILMTGLLISSAYTLPLMFEKQFISFTSFIGEGGGYHYADYFIIPGISEKIEPGDFWYAYYPHFLFYILLFLGLVIAIILCWISLRRNYQNLIVDISPIFISISLVSLFLLSKFSAFVWELIPFFKYIQFPARWLNIINFIVAFLSSVLFWIFITPAKKRMIISLLLGIISLTVILLDIKYVAYAYFIPQQKLMPVQTENSNLEHLPKWADKEHSYSNTTNKIAIMHGDGTFEINVWKSAERTIKIIAREPIVAKIQTFYFPGWKAYLDGTEIAVQIESETGAMLLDIPKGEHILELKFVDTPVRYYGKLISLLSLIAIGCYLVIEKIRKSHKVETQTNT